MMNTEHFYHLVDIENPNKLVKQTLKNFVKDNPPPKQWLSMILLPSGYRDNHEAFNQLEKLFKRVITFQLNKARLVAQLPTNDDILINNDGYRDRYLSSEILKTVIQTEIGSSRKPEYQALKIWSTLYHNYFVAHDLNDERFAEQSRRTSRQIRNYKRQGIKLLILQLMTHEKTIVEINQQQFQFEPQTYFEYEAESLIGLAQSARSLHGEQVALQKCEEAMQYAYDNRLPRYYVKASAIKIFTLLQGGIEDVQKAADVLGDVEHSNLIKTLKARPQKAWVMTKIYGMWAHVWRRGGNLDIAIESVNQAMTWLNTLHGVDTELSKDTHFIRGVMYWSSGAYDQAESDLLHILDLQPQHIYDVYEMLGLVNTFANYATKS
jgi:tetratricopeptide (TPR) repeat protein